ncbi:hypothetical protein VP1G_04050 [Cytospora mali]|uniref:DNA-directed RNA polymerase III subunit rpc4 n=1 Tax=Cytospora mali TaxID=578113 RepID=A0A194UYL0_CYTMA|nr:hypothetical protein VP1G_04050 [Valsa mali var. pyri (nom. inval.)]
MAPEGPTRGARGGAARGRGSRPRRGGAARGGRGGAAAAGNDAPEADMGDAATAAPAAPTETQTRPDTGATDAPSNPQPDPTPSASTTRPAAARPTPARAGASGAAKFLPRAVRRSQLDREAIAQKESQKQEDKVAQDARLRRGGRGRGGGRRARGGAPGGYQDRIIRGGAGGFASMIEATSSRGSGGGGGGGGSWGGGGVKSEGGPSGFSSESSRPTGRRMNTDKIVEYVVIEDEEQQVKSKEGTPVLLPKGMQRNDPKEPDQPEIATTAEVEAADRGEAIVTISSGGSEEDEDVFFNDADVEMRDDERQWPGAKPESRVKVEGEEVNEIDTLTMKKASKKAEQKAKKLQKKYKDPEDQLATETLAFQRRLFGVESDGESDTEAQEARTPRKPAIIDGNLYIFQFPPVLPPLHVVERSQKPLVKDEPNDDMVMLDAPDHKNDKPVDLTAADDFSTIKQEEGAAAHRAAGPAAAAAAAASTNQPGEQPSGYLGKLIIRKSGKMQIDYGGMLFDCESGIPVEFLRTAVLTEMDDEKKPDGYAGTAYGMGQIAGKFVSVPKWSDEEEWVVDPSELPPNGVGAAGDVTER